VSRPPSPIRAPLRAIAALFLERQHLDRPRGRRLTAASLTRFAEDTGGIQLDTINVVERAHHLTLWNRFDAYPRGTLDRLAYGQRRLFEYWAHAACLVPAAHVAMWRYTMIEHRWTGRPHRWKAWLRKNQPLVAKVEAAIREQGPMASADFEHRPPGKRGGWWDRKPATFALDYLWMSGRTAVHSRVNFQKRFDLTERVMPEGPPHASPSEAEFGRWHLRRSLHAMGAATESDLRMYLSFPSHRTLNRRAALAEALKSGEVVELAADRTNGPAVRWFALAEDIAALERAARQRAPSRGTTLLSPFDSLLWHRDRVRRLFGYDYTIEVYTPAHKRRHGYYTLPILHDGHLIGRLDPKTHREARRLEVRSVHFEPWFARAAQPPGVVPGRVDRDAALAGVASALASLARFVGADEVTLGSVHPRTLGPALRRAVR
jgi:uncharacterized protein YcaQ